MNSHMNLAKLFVLFAAFLVVGCGPSPQPTDPTAEVLAPEEEVIDESLEATFETPED